MQNGPVRLERAGASPEGRAWVPSRWLEKHLRWTEELTAHLATAEGGSRARGEGGAAVFALSSGMRRAPRPWLGPLSRTPRGVLAPGSSSAPPSPVPGDVPQSAPSLVGSRSQRIIPASLTPGRSLSFTPFCFLLNYFFLFLWGLSVLSSRF